MGRTSSTHVLPMFCDCSFHGNSMNKLLSYCGLIDAKIRVSDKDLPVQDRNIEQLAEGLAVEAEKALSR